MFLTEFEVCRNFNIFRVINVSLTLTSRCRGPQKPINKVYIYPREGTGSISWPSRLTASRRHARMRYECAPWPCTSWLPLGRNLTRWTVTELHPDTQDFMPGQLEDKWQWGTMTLQGKHGQWLQKPAAGWPLCSSSFQHAASLSGSTLSRGETQVSLLSATWPRTSRRESSKSLNSKY